MPEPSPATGEGTNVARASVTAVVGVLGAVALLLLLVTWAASIGPDQVVTQSGNPPSYETIPPTTPTASPSPTTSNQRNQGSGDRDVLFTVVSIVATLLAAIVMLAALITFVRWLMVRSWRRVRDREPDEVEFDPLDAPARMAGAMVADAAGQREALVATGSARNAIVECWHRFEQQAETAGVHRKSWETSSEFTLRVLDRLSADPAAVMTLAELYRDARHSRHEISEESRNEATRALDAVHRSLGSRAGVS
jgi:hypothetical protein